MARSDERLDFTIGQAQPLSNLLHIQHGWVVWRRDLQRGNGRHDSPGVLFCMALCVFNDLCDLTTAKEIQWPLLPQPMSLRKPHRRSV